MEGRDSMTLIMDLRKVSCGDGQGRLGSGRLVRRKLRPSRYELILKRMMGLGWEVAIVQVAGCDRTWPLKAWP